MLILGTARNIANSWPSTSKSLQTIFDAVENYQCFIIESNSSDNTLQLLTEWAAQDSRRTVISMGNLLEQVRTARIAICRNKYMEVIQPFISQHEHSLIVDLDESLCIEPSFKQQLESCFMRNDWDVVASNRRGRYYDIWALRSRAMGIDYDCWEMASKNNGILLINGLFTKVDAVQKYVYSHQKVIPTHLPWIECQSAFGCMALYKTASIANRRYDGSRTCEHVSFHVGLRIFINPAFISGGESAQHL
jgi:hypothetical protein